jgi:LmbE family N-acetylglucosaminyl deacetylase
VNREVLFLGLMITFGSPWATSQVAPPPPPPDPRFKADILLVVAHPDDETAVGSYLAKAVYDDGKRVAIIYCNRGSGGGNSVGNEQSHAEGAIREIEARKAAATFGITNVWFLDGQDTPGQDVFRSLENWHHGARLEETVRLIRLTRADVILTWLPDYVAGENHGDHQAAGVIATEAFDMAGDPTVFPAQVVPPRERTDINNATEGLIPWQAKKIYYFSDASHPVKGPGPSFDLATISPSRKVPYYRLAAELHLEHRTQGDVSEIAEKAIASSDFSKFRQWLGMIRLLFGKAVVPCEPDGDVFEGITASPVPYSAPPGYHRPVLRGISITLGGAFNFYRQFWHAHGIGNIEKLLKPEVSVAAGSYFHLPLILRNDTGDSVSIQLVSGIPRDWKELSGGATYRLAPGEECPVQTLLRASTIATSELQTITWTAGVGGKTVGSVSIDVTLADWTLPE